MKRILKNVMSFCMALVMLIAILPCMNAQVVEASTVTSSSKSVKGCTFINAPVTLSLKEKATFNIEVSGYNTKDIYWTTTKKNIAVVKKNKGNLSVTVEGKSLGSDKVNVYVGKKLIATTSVRVLKSVTTEGYTTIGDNYTSVVTWSPTTDGKDKLYGRFYYPKNYDSSKKYPVVVMCHGGGITSDIYDTYYAKAVAAEGYICYSFDVRGVKGSFGDSKSTNVASKEPGLGTYVDDCEAALDFVKTKAYADKDNIYLMGQSMGSITSQVIVSRRSDELRGIILLYGPLSDKMKDTVAQEVQDYDAFVKSLGNYNGEVLVVYGDKDPTQTTQNNLDNAHYYKNFTVVNISGASHGFGYMPDTATVTCTSTVVDFLDRTKTTNSDAAVLENKDYTKEVSYVPTADGQDTLYGRFYYPSGFDFKKQYPVVILMHGYGITSDIWDSYYAPHMAAAGYVVYSFDARGAKGDYGTSKSTNNAKITTTTPETYKTDLSSAYSYVLAKSFVDKKNVFLGGQSMGSIAVQLFAPSHNDEIKGIICLYGAFGVLRQDTDTLTYSGETLHIIGDKDPVMSVNDVYSNCQEYENFIFEDISDASHGFGYMPDRATQIASKTMLHFLDRLSSR